MPQLYTPSIHKGLFHSNCPGANLQIRDVGRCGASDSTGPACPEAFRDKHQESLSRYREAIYSGTSYKVAPAGYYPTPALFIVISVTEK